MRGRQVSVSTSGDFNEVLLLSTTPCSVNATASRLSSNKVKESETAVGTTDIAGLGDASGNVMRPTTGGYKISAIDTNGMRLKSISQEQLPSYSC